MPLRLWKQKVIRKWDLNSGKIKSCGCLMTEFNKKTKVGNDYWRYRKPKEKSENKKPKDKSKERLRRVLKNMKSRCYNPNFTDYKNYGARGIKICDLWIGNNGFKNFYKWAMASGYKEGLTLDRIDFNGNYEPSNCRWATMREQQNNRSNNLLLTYNGKTQTASQWGDETGIKKGTICARIRNGWSVERALTEKPWGRSVKNAEESKE